MISSSRNQYAPQKVSPPGSTLADLLDERSLSQRELAKRMGRPTKTVNEIIKGKTAITQDTALALELAVGVPASFWNAREARYREHLARGEQLHEMAQHADWVRLFPYAEMAKLGWVAAATRVAEKAHELLKFFSIAKPEQWVEVYEEPQGAFRRSPKVKGKAAPISAWLRRGEIQAAAIRAQEHDPDGVRACLPSLRALTREADPKKFAPALREACAQVGIIVVFTPELKGCGVSGVTRWLSSGHALIQLSLRYKTDDHLWFTFFHEVGHVLLHPKKRTVFLDADGGSGSPEENEANRFAADTLLTPAPLAAFIAQGVFTADAIRAFASHEGVSPGVVVGRLQHERRVPFGHHEGLKGRFAWTKDQ
jgi:HTH-type transcriptional regulator / antitoxin HigA